MLISHELPVPKEEAERVDTLRYTWQKLQERTTEISGHLIEIQPDFHSDLIEKVKIFNQDTADFYRDYAEVC